MNKRNVSYGGSGQFTGTIQFGDSNTAPVPSATGGEINTTSFEGVDLVLTADTGCTFSGKANITTVQANRPAADRMTGTWNFEFDGPVSRTWDESGA